MHALAMFVVRNAAALDQAVDGAPVWGVYLARTLLMWGLPLTHRPDSQVSDLLPGVVRAVDSLPPDVVKQVLRSFTASADAVHAALSTQVGGK